MLRRLLTMAVRGYVGGPGKSWVFTSLAMMLLRAVSKTTGKTESIDLSSTKPGDKIVIEHLDITHKQQLKDAKRTQKSDKAALKEAKKQHRAAKKLTRQG